MCGSQIAQLTVVVLLGLVGHVHSQCLTTLAVGCSPSSPCCSNLACYSSLCLPCLPAGSPGACTASTCCAGATCTNGRCVSSTANDPVSATPAPAVPANPPSCVTLLASCGQTGASSCCAGSTCRSSICYPCLSSGAICFGTSSCCDGLVCSANRCQAPVANPFTALPPNDPIAVTPATSPAPLDPANCRPLNTLGCSDSVTSQRCCAGSFCNFATACVQCIGAGNSTACVVNAQDTRRCCEGLECVGGTCTAPQDPTQTPTVSVPGVTVANPTPATPITAPLDPANCRPLNTLGCSDSVTSQRCCAGSFCNFATACVQCIGAGNSTACVVNAQDTRRCCEGLECVGGTCTAPQDPTQTPTVSSCAQFGAPCSATSPCCPGGLTCSAQTNTCTFNIVGRLS